MAVADRDAQEGKPKISADTLTVRHLQSADLDRGFIDLLGQLTVVGDSDRDALEERFRLLEAGNCTHILVIEDEEKGRIIAAGTLLLEHKFIRGCGTAGHIEDVVVDSSYRGLRLGARIISALVEEARRQKCYKIILDCSEHNVDFYAKSGFVRKEVQMVQYLDQ